MSEVTKYARKCDVTGKGMNEGYCFGDGVFYCHSYEHAIYEVRQDSQVGSIGWTNENEEGKVILEPFELYHEFTEEELAAMSDDDIMSVAYGNAYYYHSEWGEDEADYEDEYYLEDGTLIEVN
jgi:hypothetical protein